jgi:AcrR family transcriptional regulator
MEVGTTTKGRARRSAPATAASGGDTRAGGDTKRRILDAAEEVVLRDGVAHLTLDAAATEAGLSKGGVLYHFPTRGALVAGMVAKIIKEFEEDIERELRSSDGPGAFTRAYIRSTLAPGTATPDRQDRLGAALIAAAAAEPALLLPLQGAADRWQARLEGDGLDPTVATVLRLACDGLWLCDLFGLAPPSAALRSRVGAELEAMTKRPS